VHDRVAHDVRPPPMPEAGFTGTTNAGSANRQGRDVSSCVSADGLHRLEGSIDFGTAVGHTTRAGTGMVGTLVVH
jgi:hypothetical protein